MPKSDWLIIVGHHPADEIDVEDFVSAMTSHGFALCVLPTLIRVAALRFALTCFANTYVI